MSSGKFNSWLNSGTPFIWINAGAVAISIIMVLGLLLILSVNGLSHFWPSDVLRGIYAPPAANGQAVQREFFGELLEIEEVSGEQLQNNGLEAADPQSIFNRQLMKFGNRDLTGSDFGWIVSDFILESDKPERLTVLERRAWGVFYGFLLQLRENGEISAETTPEAENQESIWGQFQQKLQRVESLYADIGRLEGQEVAQVNYQVEQLRLRQRRLELEDALDPEVIAAIESARQQLEAEYSRYQTQLNDWYRLLQRDSALFEAANGQQVEIQLADIVRAYQPNAMGVTAKIGTYFSRLTEFLTAEPREANTEGGIFPAIFGTVVMVLLMSVFVTPFGVIAAVYLREYARQGPVTRMIRIAVNNLAGVPSIVYGVFGLGFFIYIVGAEIDQTFYPEALPAPTFGTPGLLWASLTLALLTVPVVIVATEEGLARIPRSLREGSLALGATKFETIVRVIFPIASPAMMTGLILAVARAAGEVAPLMLVGVVKLAPALPVNGIYPYVHLDQKFMHLGYHIYDVGFQSPNIDAARPLVFATALLLVVVIALLNLTAAALRNSLREKYKALDV